VIGNVLDFFFCLLLAFGLIKPMVETLIGGLLNSELVEV
jgi:hypothetical protein